LASLQEQRQATAAAAARASDDKVNQLLTDLINEF